MLKGLAIGVGSMKIGERALLHINHSLAYGKEGSFSFPNVPPATDVMYEVELIGYEEPREVCSVQKLELRVHTSNRACDNQHFPGEAACQLWDFLTRFVLPSSGKATR